MSSKIINHLVGTRKESVTSDERRISRELPEDSRVKYDPHANNNNTKIKEHFDLRLIRNRYPRIVVEGA